MGEMGAHYAPGKGGKLIPTRLRTHTDITNGLKAVCEENGVKFGAVLFGIGSIRKVTYQILGEKPDSPMGAGYLDPVTLPGPIEVISMHGIVFQSEDGQTLLHLHGTFCDKEGKVFGGHIVAGGNPVLATLDAYILQTEGAETLRQMDEDIGMALGIPQGHFVKVKA
jgi:predicted DNA-binding protein with PD1-like motif